MAQWRLAFSSVTAREYVYSCLRPEVRRSTKSPSQDEIYVVMSGSSELITGEQRTACSVGDVLFVPANAVHHFENFSDDFVTWAIFWGTEGGEAAT